MYSIVLIDDERWMLEQMWRILEWGSLDCKIAGEFTDAQKALAEIARLAPDIILCDISMPSMSGLDFLDELRKRKIDTEVIFISGYNRFEYAGGQEGIREYDKAMPYPMREQGQRPETKSIGGKEGFGRKQRDCQKSKGIFE